MPKLSLLACKERRSPGSYCKEPGNVWFDYSDFFEQQWLYTSVCPLCSLWLIRRMRSERMSTLLTTVACSCQCRKAINVVVSQCHRSTKQDKLSITAVHKYVISEWVKGSAMRRFQSTKLPCRFLSVAGNWIPFDSIARRKDTGQTHSILPGEKDAEQIYSVCAHTVCAQIVVLSGRRIWYRNFWSLSVHV